MSQADLFGDPMMDFEDTDLFLSAILSSVPPLDKLPNPYDLDFTETSALIGNPENTLNNQYDNPSKDTSSVNSTSSSTANIEPSLFASDNKKKRSSFSSTSYSELVASSASNEGTPNTTILSPHTLPEGMPDEVEKKDFKVPQSHLKKESVTSAEETPVSTKPSKSKVSAKDKVSKPAKKPKVSHNMIEKKYRTNINTKIYKLRDAVPTLKIAAGKSDVQISDLEGLAPAAKLNKASVLTKATEYIKHLEKKNSDMMSKISQLQQLIGEANANPPQVDLNLPLRMDDRQSRPEYNMNNFDGQFGFGFAPENNYNTTSNQFEMLAITPQQQQYSQHEGAYQPYNSNWMMGGLATFVGSSVLSNDNFKGLAALPFMPSFVAHPSATTLQTLAILRVGLVGFGLYLMLLPIINAARKPRDEKSPVQSLWLTWLLVLLGFQVPKQLNSSQKDQILGHVMGNSTDSSDWVRDYAILSSSEVTFETAFLNVLIGTFITEKYPLFSKFIAPTLQTKAALLRKLDCSEHQESLKRLSQLIKNLDGFSMFTSEKLIARFLNVSTRRNIFAGVKAGENSLLYIEVFKRYRKDIYSIIFGWRILDLLYEVNLRYLKSLTSKSEDEEAEELKDSLNTDLITIGKLVDDFADPGLKQYYLLVRSLMCPESTPEMIQNMKQAIVQTVSSLNSYFDGQELTDDEDFSDSEEAEESSDDTEVDSIGKGRVDAIEALKEEKSLLYSLNLVDEEKFIVLTASSILFYLQKEDHENVQHLLKHLRQITKKFPLSTLSFTCLVKVICHIVETAESEQRFKLSEENFEILESVVKVMREWLNDDKKSQFLSHSFRSELANSVVTKGMLLHSI